VLEQIRELVPLAGIRSNVIGGFPGETEDDVQLLTDFLTEARVDVEGVFGYSDEDGTEAVGLDGHLDDDEVAALADRVRDLADALVDQRAEERIGETVEVLIESLDADDPTDPVLGDRASSPLLCTGRARHQGPEVDGTTTVRLAGPRRIGDLVTATVVDSDGVDLVAAESAPSDRG